MNQDKIVKKAEQLLNYPNTIGYSVEDKILVVFVEKKLDEEELRKDELIPKVFCGLQTDVVEMDIPEPIHRSKHSPLVGGISIGPQSRRIAGTLGLVVKGRSKINMIGDNKYIFPDEFYQRHNYFINEFLDKEEKEIRFGLTNEHVADEGKVVQPSRIDARSVREIGTVVSIGDIDEQLLDFSVIRLNEDEDILESVHGLEWSGKYRVGRPSRGERLYKSGRTTSVTNSRVTSNRISTVVNFNRGRILMKDLVAVNNQDDFTRPGDSGSSILDEDGNLVGFGFASNSIWSFYIPMDSILTKYQYIFKDYEEVKG